MLRNVIAVIIGIITGTALYIGIQIFGLFNVQKQESMAVLLCIVAPGVRSFCGCWIAARLGSSRPMLLAMIVGGALTVVDLWGLTFLHMHPGLGLFPVLLNLGGAWVAGFIEQKRRAAGATPAPAPAETGKEESVEA